MILVNFFEPPFTREFVHFFRKVVNCELIKLMIYYDIYSSIYIILNNIYWTLLQIRKILYRIDIHTNNKNNNLENQIYFAEYWKIAFRVIDVYESTLKKTEICRLWKNVRMIITIIGKLIIHQPGLDWGLCNKYVAFAMDLLTRFPKLCFACIYINIFPFFFFLRTRAGF